MGPCDGRTYQTQNGSGDEGSETEGKSTKTKRKSRWQKVCGGAQSNAANLRLLLKLFPFMALLWAVSLEKPLKCLTRSLETYNCAKRTIAVLCVCGFFGSHLFGTHFGYFPHSHFLPAEQGNWTAARRKAIRGRNSHFSRLSASRQSEHTTYENVFIQHRSTVVSFSAPQPDRIAHRRRTIVFLLCWRGTLRGIPNETNELIRNRIVRSARATKCTDTDTYTRTRTRRIRNSDPRHTRTRTLGPEQNKCTANKNRTTTKQTAKEMPNSEREHTEAKQARPAAAPKETGPWQKWRERLG